MMLNECTLELTKISVRQNVPNIAIISIFLVHGSHDSLFAFPDLPIRGTEIEISLMVSHAALQEIHILETASHYQWLPT